MIVCYSKGFVVQHMEKTGGTTVVQSLAPHLEQYDLVMTDWMKFIFNQRGDGISEHAASSAIAMFLGDSWKNFKKFSTVRDPVELMKSFYNYSKSEYERHVGTPNQIPPDGSLKAYIYSENTGYGPDGFVDFMFARGYMSVSPQVDRLHHMLGDGLIVDLSELDSSWDGVTSYLGFNNKIDMVKKRVLHSSRVEFSLDTVKRIKNHFEKDYDILPGITGVRWR